jgi:hypothetical protein
VTVQPADEDVEAVLGAHMTREPTANEWREVPWLASLASLSARLDAAVEGQAAAEQRAADAEKALRQIEDTSPNWMQAAAEADCCSRMREIASNALAAAHAGEATEEKEPAT